MKKIIFLSLLIAGTSAFLWQGETLPQAEQVMNDFSKITRIVSEPIQSVLGSKENVKADETNESSLEELESEYDQFDGAELEKLVNDASFNQKLNNLILKSNLNELKQEERNELALLIRKKAVIYKVLLDRELESIERKNI